MHAKLPGSKSQLSASRARAAAPIHAAAEPNAGSEVVGGLSAGERKTVIQICPDRDKAG